MPTSRRNTLARDRVFYPVSDDMGEHELQTLMRELLRPLLARLLASRGLVAHAGSDQFIYWERGNVKACVAPDLYVLPGVPQERVIKSWKTWEERGLVPSLAIEIVTTDVVKDYEECPELYRALGVRELVIYDPKIEAAPRRIKRWRFQVYRRTSRGFSRVVATDVDRVRSHALGAWLRVVGEGMARRLRIATGLRGETLLPTSDEVAKTAHGRAEEERNRAEAERKRADAEHERAEAECERAEAERERAEAERERANRLETALRRALDESRSRRRRRPRRA
jgi:hypothetical protein